MDTSTTHPSPDSAFQALETYPWDDDVEFQAGLSAILGSNSSPEQATELTLRARCFYYSRKYSTPIDFDAYKAYRTSLLHPQSQSQSQSQPASHLPIQAPLSIPVSDPPSAPSEHASGILPSAPPNANEPPAPYPTTFAQIVELVTTGQPIPGIKEIPDTVLDGQGSVAVKGRRRKPWEKEEGGELK
ncbi:hypothetical protein P154DRAFT_481976 [Amniculicola lignicola CBS 123094]|uniref:Uncharacterized protein n=1 Tax=Amniculicola lignicola CBS 123094 TaxID=1392246 RepID=A0A6A5WWW9_9PLEO|nr:hypothetical protein P154DRAFT_481976 [Amniculicola lignicola CBS 123094]